MKKCFLWFVNLQTDLLVDDAHTLLFFLLHSSPFAHYSFLNDYISVSLKDAYGYALILLFIRLLSYKFKYPFFF